MFSPSRETLGRKLLNDAMRSWDHKKSLVKIDQTFWPKITRAENYRTVAWAPWEGSRFWFWRNFDGLCGATKQSVTPRGSEPRWTSSRGGEPEAAASLLTGNLAHFRKIHTFFDFVGLYRENDDFLIFWQNLRFFNDFLSKIIVFWGVKKWSKMSKKVEHV